MSDLVRLLAGGALLYFGAEWFVGGASAVALSLRVPQLLIGLTVVAYGTSAPEVVVGIEAAAAGHGAVALGNVIGSNIANAGLILGVVALVRPARVHRTLRARELPVLVATTLLVPLVLWDGTVRWFEGLGLLAASVGYTGWLVRAGRRASGRGAGRAEASVAAAAADAAGAPRPGGLRRSILTAAAGLAFLLVGGRLFIDGAVDLAHRVGLSERVIGLTVVAIGTSLPELVTSVVAARRGHSDFALGNVVGSNIFNVLLCLGAAALAGTVGAPLEHALPDLAALFALTAFTAFAIRRERTIGRAEGGLFLGAFVAFTVWAVLSA